MMVEKEWNRCRGLWILGPQSFVSLLRSSTGPPLLWRPAFPSSLRWSRSWGDPPFLVEENPWRAFLESRWDWITCQIFSSKDDNESRFCFGRLCTDLNKQYLSGGGGGGENGEGYLKVKTVGRSIICLCQDWEWGILQRNEGMNESFSVVNSSRW